MEIEQHVGQPALGADEAIRHAIHQPGELELSQGDLDLRRGEAQLVADRFHVSRHPVEQFVHPPLIPLELDHPPVERRVTYEASPNLTRHLGVAVEKVFGTEPGCGAFVNQVVRPGTHPAGKLTRHRNDVPTLILCGLRRDEGTRIEGRLGSAAETTPSSAVPREGTP
jgi:hypothetical protein